MSSFVIVGVNQRQMRVRHLAGFQPRFQIPSMRIRGYKPLQQRYFVTIECLWQSVSLTKKDWQFRRFYGIIMQRVSEKE